MLFEQDLQHRDWAFTRLQAAWGAPDPAAADGYVNARKQGDGQILLLGEAAAELLAELKVSSRIHLPLPRSLQHAVDVTDLTDLVPFPPSVDHDIAAWCEWLHPSKDARGCRRRLGHLQSPQSSVARADALANQAQDSCQRDNCETESSAAEPAQSNSASNACGPDAASAAVSPRKQRLRQGVATAEADSEQLQSVRKLSKQFADQVRVLCGITLQLCSSVMCWNLENMLMKSVLAHETNGASGARLRKPHNRTTLG